MQKIQINQSHWTSKLDHKIEKIIQLFPDKPLVKIGKKVNRIAIWMFCSYDTKRRKEMFEYQRTYAQALEQAEKFVLETHYTRQDRTDWLIKYGNSAEAKRIQNDSRIIKY